MGDLRVELYGVTVGSIRGDWRTFDFMPDRAAAQRFGIDSTILSLAIPLGVLPVRSGKQRRQDFFRELLPEGQMLTGLAEAAGLPSHDVVGLLRAYGRDVAGALQIWDPEQAGEPRVPRREEVSEARVGQMLQQVQEFPLGNKPGSGKTSLAGVQDKIVLDRDGDTWSRVMDGWPSTHILKPETRDHPTVIFDEEYGARLARSLGLAGFKTWVQDFQGVSAVVIERYDRDPDLPGGRIHQEDFNQVLGAVGNQKYQRFGGGVSLHRIANALVTAQSSDQLPWLLRMVTMAVGVGNLDLHAKNLSVLHRLDAPVALAPAYDVVPQAHHSNDGEVALAINGRYRHAALTRVDLVAEGQSWGVRDSEAVVNDTLESLRDAVGMEAPLNRAHPGLVEDVRGFTERLLDGKAAGRPSSR